MGNLSSRLECGGERDILVLGASGAGKTTIATQLRIAQEGGFDEEERAARRGVIYGHVVRAARLVVDVMQINGAECSEDHNRRNIEIILGYDLDVENLAYMPAELTTAIAQLWADAEFKRTVNEYAWDFVQMDSAAYFFEEILRIGEPGYSPTDTDIVRTYKNTVGIAELNFPKSETWRKIHLFDIGTRVPECEKWIEDFEGTLMIVFCVALSDYDRASFDGKHENRMLESIAMFEHIVNLECFSNTTIVIFLNKLDLFRSKLATVPLQWYFPEYSGGHDINAALKYIWGRFTGVIRTPRTRSVAPVITTATDAKTAKWVANAVRGIELQNALKASGFC